MNITEKSILNSLSSNGDTCINADCKRSNFTYTPILRDGDLPVEEVACLNCGVKWVVGLSHASVRNIFNREGVELAQPLTSKDTKISMSSNSHIVLLRRTRQIVDLLKASCRKLRPVNTTAAIQALDASVPPREVLF